MGQYSQGASTQKKFIRLFQLHRSDIFLDMALGVISFSLEASSWILLVALFSFIAAASSWTAVISYSAEAPSWIWLENFLAAAQRYLIR